MENESRKHSRIPVRLKLENWPVPQLRGYDIFSYDISQGGIKLEIIPPLSSDSDLKVDDNITISFELSKDHGFLSLSSRVAWRKDGLKNSDGKEVSYVGVQFNVVPESTGKMIDEFLERVSSQKA